MIRCFDIFIGCNSGLIREWFRFDQVTSGSGEDPDPAGSDSNGSGRILKYGIQCIPSLQGWFTSENSLWLASPMLVSTMQLLQHPTYPLHVISYHWAPVDYASVHRSQFKDFLWPSSVWSQTWYGKPVRQLWILYLTIILSQAASNLGQVCLLYLYYYIITCQYYLNVHIHTNKQLHLHWKSANPCHVDCDSHTQWDGSSKT